MLEFTWIMMPRTFKTCLLGQRGSTVGNTLALYMTYPGSIPGTAHDSLNATRSQPSALLGVAQNQKPRWIIYHYRGDTSSGSIHTQYACLNPVPLRTCCSALSPLWIWFIPTPSPSWQSTLHVGATNNTSVYWWWPII